MGVGGAAGRLVELGERQRRAQFEAARALLLRDGDGGQEGFFRGRGVGGVALEQDFAARPMQFRFERAIAQCGRHVASASSRIAMARSGSPARASASASAIFKSPSKIRTFCSRRARRRGACPRARSPSAPLAAVAQPSRNTPNARHKGRSCSRARRASLEGVRRGARGSPRINSNMAACILPKGERADMGEVRDPRLHAVNERNRAIDLAERP